LARMARDRRRRGLAGRHNDGRRFLLNGFLPERSTGSDIVKALTRYMKLELTEGWRSWFVQEPEDSRAGQAVTSSGRVECRA
jgi:hypothetical protein